MKTFSRDALLVLVIAVTWSCRSPLGLGENGEKKASAGALEILVVPAKDSWNETETIALKVQFRNVSTSALWLPRTMTFRAPNSDPARSEEPWLTVTDKAGRQMRLTCHLDPSSEESRPIYDALPPGRRIERDVTLDCFHLPAGKYLISAHFWDRPADALFPPSGAVPLKDRVDSLPVQVAVTQ
jgi:hypothetical protein